jgi:hypothetical protein
MEYEDPDQQDMALACVEEEVEFIDSLFGDLAYINEMARLEREFFGNNSIEGATEKKAPSDIVPVTGLILSRFHRLENELKTILEHWGRRERRAPERKESGFGKQWVNAFLSGLNGMVKGYMY